MLGDFSALMEVTKDQRFVTARHCNEHILNLPDIYDDKPILFKPKTIHFDLEHYNFIVWNNEQDLYSRLLNRIKATIV